MRVARLQDRHIAKCGVEGKCSVPMWSAYGPDGFCDNQSWGQQYSEREVSRGQSGKYADPTWPLRDRNGYYPSHLSHLGPRMAGGYCCANHGGPREDQIRFVRDGNMWCAFMPDFVNLQESHAGFGETQDMAEADLVSKQP